MCSKGIKLKLKTISTKRLKALDLTVVVSTNDRYEDSGEHPGPFAKFLNECGIIPWYTIPRPLNMNGVGKRPNRTINNMVRSMISHSTLLESL